MKIGSSKFSLGALNEALARSLSLKSTFWGHTLLSGSTPVDRNSFWELKMKPGSTPVDKSNVLEVQIDSGLTPVGKSNVLEVKIKLWHDACR